MSRRITLLVVLWVGLALAGLLRLAAFDTAPGPHGPLDAQWPPGAALRLDPRAEGPTLLLFLHGKCPCSQASLSELAEVLARSRVPLRVHVYVYRPATKAEHWTETALWKQARALPGINLHWDDDGDEARRFGALTSGEVLLWAVTGVEAATERAARARRALVGGLCAAGLCVQLLGCALYWDHHSRVLLLVRQQAEIPSAWSEDHLPFGYYVPQFSPLVGHAWLVRHVLNRDADLGRDAPWKLIVPQPVDLRAEGKALRLDFWAADFRRASGAAPWVLPLWLSLFGGGALIAGVQLGRRYRAAAPTRVAE